ncbi:hypothetical protein DAMNIGENAA_11110 [Desulforhabdus amnigena]|uniref:F420-non-reducing hydrogenase iron-sulfur subunit D domain-containing protein n=1 Tax=Desulforhabdus amnigena TaxID=40218 RepID=A0A9W6FS43_9BACT|nr:hypothetical protein DAMNIGENAA_11110 [Desulforhabdus amnigena]
MDGVFVGGCHLGDCHYLYGNHSANKRVRFLRQLLTFSGVDGERLSSTWVSSAEAPEFVMAIKGFIEKLKILGPSPLRKAEAG